MIGTIDIECNAANPSIALRTLYTFAGSPSSVRVLNVPRKIGNWKIERVYVSCQYPDNSIRSVETRLTGGCYVGTVPGCETCGKTTGGFTVTASGTDENGTAVSGYVLGKGDVVVLSHDSTITVDGVCYYLHLVDQVPAEPHKGDTIITGGKLRIYSGAEWIEVGGDDLWRKSGGTLSPRADVTEVNISAYTVIDDLSSASIPTKVSQLANDRGYLTSDQFWTNCGTMVVPKAPYYSVRATSLDACGIAACTVRATSVETNSITLSGQGFYTAVQGVQVDKASVANLATYTGESDFVRDVKPTGNPGGYNAYYWMMGNTFETDDRVISRIQVRGAKGSPSGVRAKLLIWVNDGTNFSDTSTKIISISDNAPEQVVGEEVYMDFTFSRPFRIEPGKRLICMAYDRSATWETVRNLKWSTLTRTTKIRVYVGQYGDNDGYQIRNEYDTSTAWRLSPFAKYHYHTRLATLSSVPTKTSQLSNDSGFLSGDQYLYNIEDTLVLKRPYSGLVVSQSQHPEQSPYRYSSIGTDTVRVACGNTFWSELRFDGLRAQNGGPERYFSFPNNSGRLALTSDMPTKTSQLSNDSGFVTRSRVWDFERCACANDYQNVDLPDGKVTEILSFGRDSYDFYIEEPRDDQMVETVLLANFYYREPPSFSWHVGRHETAWYETDGDTPERGHEYIYQIWTMPRTSHEEGLKFTSIMTIKKLTYVPES